ncbi:epimerase [Blastopirellula marina]|uniref:Epimerase n=1 Tax=Blastopirellula marina TaxID=124 RepID=A0A2S8G9V9_9BACT|nr:MULTISPECIES: DUF1731 domain-containing protein [Pirellulaceae]PQO41255.1 epimerase [Blastopirellula marina]RCS56279.1 DUF1731 domain-containing protein [Bremerella cremea]
MTTTPNPRRIVIAGGSGFLGISLAHFLHENNFHVTLLSRSAPKCDGPWKHVAWDGRTLGNWKACLDGATGMVNLAGRTVDCIKTPDHQDEILRSRVESTRVLGLAVRAIDQPPPVWVQMGTAHIYGDPPEASCTEDSSLGVGLAPWVGKAWEEEFERARLDSQRGVVLRTSFVIGCNRGAGGGALDRLSLLTRLGLGGRIGSGKQGFSWIHELDLNRLFEQSLTQDSMRGIYIASAPNPVSQVEFMRALREALGVRFGLPAFAWMVRLGAPLLLRTDPDLALYGRYVRSARLQDEGFTFQFPEVGPALENIAQAARHTLRQ